MWGAVKAGYTLAELLLLSRSASLPQRAAAFHVLGAVLKRARIPAPQATQQEGTSVVSQTSKWFSGSQFHYVWFDFFFDSLRMGLPPSFVWMCMTSRS